MRYLALILFTSAMWILIWFAGAASNMLHAAFGALALFYIVYVLVLGRLESRRAGPTGQSSGSPDGGR